MKYHSGLLENTVAMASDFSDSGHQIITKLQSDAI